MNCNLRCSCGKLEGVVETGRSYNRCICYCRDCQAFAHYLQKPDEMLDGQGGTSMLQTVPSAVRITKGADQLACMSLKRGVLLRWYTRCCGTPVGNTPANFKLPFVGLIQTCLAPAEGASLEDSFGPIRIRVNTESATGEPKPSSSSKFKVILSIAPMLLKSRLLGRHKKSCFFTESGNPAASPKVLDKAEYKRLIKSL